MITCTVRTLYSSPSFCDVVKNYPNTQLGVVTMFSHCRTDLQSQMQVGTSKLCASAVCQIICSQIVLDLVDYIKQLWQRQVK